MSAARFPTELKKPRKNRFAFRRIVGENRLIPPMMSQRAGTLSYVVFAAGFSLAVFVLCYGLCDVYHFQSRFLRTFGTNALLAYVLHDLIASAVKPFSPSDAPGWYVVAALCLFFAITWSFVRHFEKNGIYLRA